MAKTVADLLWEMLANAGVKRCYGIVVQREFASKIPEMLRKA